MYYISYVYDFEDNSSNILHFTLLTALLRFLPYFDTLST